MSAIREQPLVIQGALTRPMLGVLSSPSDSVRPSGTGIVIVNGGAQYRAGAHRLHIQLARQLAGAGHAVLRFDLPGQGDSPGEPVGFEDTAPHIGAAIDALHRQQPQLQHTALFGLCDGASASLLYLHALPDPRITRLILLNPWVRSEASLAKAHIRHYYRQRLLMPDFWRKLLRGRVGWQSAQELWLALCKRFGRTGPQAGAPGFQHRMALAWASFPGQILLLLSEQDLTAQEFRDHANQQIAWRHSLDKAMLDVVVLPEADHTCSRADSAKAFRQQVAEWLCRPKAP